MVQVVRREVMHMDGVLTSCCVLWSELEFMGLVRCSAVPWFVSAHHDMQFSALAARNSPGSYKLLLSVTTSQWRTRAVRQTCGSGVLFYAIAMLQSDGRYVVAKLRREP